MRFGRRFGNFVRLLVFDLALLILCFTLFACIVVCVLRVCLDKLVVLRFDYLLRLLV